MNKVIAAVLVLGLVSGCVSTYSASELAQRYQYECDKLPRDAEGHILWTYMPGTEDRANPQWSFDWAQCK